jgi:hypothetical protein
VLNLIATSRNPPPSMQRPQLVGRNPFSSFGSFFACLMGAETTIWVSCRPCVANAGFRRLLAPSVRLTEHESEGDNEELVIGIVADMHNPVAPILRAAFHDERSDDAGCTVARLGEVAYRFTRTIDPDSSWA